MLQENDIVAMEDYREIVCRTNSNDLEWLWWSLLLIRTFYLPDLGNIACINYHIITCESESTRGS